MKDVLKSFSLQELSALQRMLIVQGNTKVKQESRLLRCDMCDYKKPCKWIIDALGTIIAAFVMLLALLTMSVVAALSAFLVFAIIFIMAFHPRYSDAAMCAIKSKLKKKFAGSTTVDFVVEPEASCEDTLTAVAGEDLKRGDIVTLDASNMAYKAKITN